VFFASYPLFAQELHSSCQNMRYEHHNQIDPPPRRVGFISGVVKDSQGFEVRGACVGIFTEAEQLLVAIEGLPSAACSLEHIEWWWRPKVFARQVRGLLSKANPKRTSCTLS
jgi:hypothetical protein